jgi:hypothetical protein
VVTITANSANLCEHFKSWVLADLGARRPKMVSVVYQQRSSTLDRRWCYYIDENLDASMRTSVFSLVTGFLVGVTWTHACADSIFGGFGAPAWSRTCKFFETKLFQSV